MLSLEQHGRPPTELIDVLGQPPFERVGRVWLVPKRHQFAADLLRFPEQVLVWVVQRGTW